MDSLFDKLLIIIFVLVAALSLYKLIKHGSFKAAMFGAGIKRTVGEVSGSGPRLMSISLKVHELDESPEKAIGLEMVAKSIASYQMTPLTLSVTEAQKLIELLSSVSDTKRPK